ncbi:putative ribonuclease HI [Erwinia phage vB_EamM_RAY]|jgi:ribonuclease HI|uniref:ribonuclease H n=9 Tax=Agricanvirus TaxID=1984776 RepID=A0A173GEQ0_9CAUD|nr:ribonuclease [Erwinia phage Ea35-70]YP_009605295.1 ribonuclease [Erwinia phage vB_EamM_Deimos-Minion]YP_009605614.1 ribonuclease [Erwinia phage vB_EamM_RAY]YP_009605934.1 ribonuclease [Erwinia phage vB_EamM_Simmy50]YP_009606255.1 ribonuclease [Erwinia phage vB_EamM_Special G]YP_009621888.1 ribonuclease [Erwinia phage vB_EamM_Desertfox]AUG85935.1 putative ribonuclease HI [Erwinia phage vB_EamM_Bosolaphorus]AUG86576.1 putative ribonuclease HI [Erwinia phage vB_EamM_MadMel]QBP07255.1 putati
MDKLPSTALPKVSMVLYTDGGCRQNIGGWGIHGYSWLVEDDDKKKKKKPARDVPSTTGYIVKDDPKLDSREVVRPHEVIEGFGGILPNTTNNVAELTATINGIDLALQQNTEKLLVISDSKYVGDNAKNQLHRWMKAGWKKADGGDVANKELWETLSSKLDELKYRGISFDIEWLKGHAGHRGNQFADYMATRGVFKGRVGDATPYYQIQDAGEYDKYKTERPRFVTHSRWYFTLQTEKLMNKNEQGLYEYCFGHPSKGDADQQYLGKALADTAFSVVWLKAPEECLDLVYSRTKEIATDVYGNAFIGRLDNIYNSFIHKEIMDYGGSLLQRANKYNNDITNCTDAQVVRECNPPGISYRALSNLGQLSKILNEFVSDSLPATTRVVEITDKIYQTVKGKKEDKLALLGSIRQTDKALKFDVPCDVLDKAISVEVTATLGLTLPNRNTLNGLTELNPKVYLFLTKESDIAFRYGSIVVCDEGYCIMANVYADLRTLSKKDLERCGQ